MDNKEFNDSTKNIKLISVNLRGHELKIPLSYRLMAAISYEKTLKDTNDAKKAFCAMILEMITSNKDLIGINREEAFYNNLTLEDINTISDNELQKIGNQILEQYMPSQKYYCTDSNNNYFENFQKAFSEYKKEMAEKILKPFKNLYSSSIIPNLKSLFSNIDSMKKLNNASILEEICSPITNDSVLKELFAPIEESENPIFKNNQLLEDLSLKFESFVKEEQNARKKQDKRNVWILGVAILTLLVSATSSPIFKLIYEWLKKARG